MARLFADENFPLPVVEELRRLGHDVVTLSEIGKAGQSMPDEGVLNFARADGRAALTLNRKHFVRLHGDRDRLFVMESGTRRACRPGKGISSALLPRAPAEAPTL